MKTGIITFHFCYNYGATLQCLALYQSVKNLGHEVNVIDFFPIPMPVLRFWQGWGLRRKNPMRNIRNRWIDLKYADLMRKRFDSFSKANLSYSTYCNPSNISAAVSSYDALIVGSDQVWNRSYYNASPVYFLNFKDNYEGRRVSYAACSGSADLPPHDKEELELRTALLDFDAISVRNEITHNWLENVASVSAELVCDPTLLIDFTEYEAEATLPVKDYILVYVLGKEITGGHQQTIQRIKDLYGALPVVWICSSAHKPESYCNWADHLICTAGPAEWLTLIKNANFVYTDSFHGAIFSMKYERAFFAYYVEEMRAGRLIDIATRYGLNHVIASSLQDALDRKCFEQELDYPQINSKINAQRKTSLEFLKEALR